ncbi:MAG: alpha/beta hydrolase [Bacteroidales bacterium]|nr:alpha/beta hydrolase [Bacteroidales bacterium]
MNSIGQQIIELPVWPKGAPQDNGITVDEKTQANGHIEFSKEARIFVYLPADSVNTGKSVLICPGGGYHILAMQHEGHDVAKWLASQGVAAFVLKYRMPNQHSDIPLSDAKEAMRIIRGYSKEWKIDSAKVGVCGFSAGGHLASTLETHSDKDTRPNFGILFYPVVSMKDSITHQGSKKALLGDHPTEQMISLFSNENMVTSNTPPTLFLLADDDKAVIPENSILLYRALKQNKIKASLHVFPIGGHGFGFRESYKYHQQIKAIISDWIKDVVK